MACNGYTASGCCIVSLRVYGDALWLASYALQARAAK